MQIAKVLFDRMIGLLLADVTGLHGLGDDLFHMKFIVAPFTERLDLVLTDLTIDDGSKVVEPALLPIADYSEFYYDCFNSDRHLQYVRDSGLWMAKVGGGIPFTLYGTALVFGDDATLLAVKALDPPIPFSGATQAAEMPPVDFRFPFSMIT